MDRVTSTGLWTRGVRRLTAGLVLTVTVVAFESLSVATILPVVSHHLGDLRLYGWVFSAFFLASLLGIVAGGAVADSRGVAPPLLGGLLLFAVGLVIAGLAPDMPVLVAGRAVQGVGAGAAPAAAYTAIARAYDEAVRPRMLATLSTAWVVPGLVGPAIAAQVAAHIGWRAVFLGLLPLVAVSAVIAIPGVRSGPAGPVGPTGPAGGSGSAGGTTPPVAAAPHNEPMEVGPGDVGAERRTRPAAVAVATGAGLVLAGLTASSPVPTALLLAGGLALLGPALRRLTPAGTLRARPGLPAAVLVRGLLTFAFFAGDAFVPLLLTSIRHTSTTFAGLTLTASTMVWTAASWIEARAIRRVGPRRLVLTGLGVLLIGVGGMASVLTPATPVWVAPIAWAVAGGGIGLAYSPLTLVALGWADPGKEGRASASIQLTDVLGTALGTGVSGAAVAAAHEHGADPRLGLAIALGAGGLVALIGLAAAGRLPRALAGPVEEATAAEPPATDPTGPFGLTVGPPMSTVADQDRAPGRGRDRPPRRLHRT